MWYNSTILQLQAQTEKEDIMTHSSSEDAGGPYHSFICSPVPVCALRRIPAVSAAYRKDTGNE